MALMIAALIIIGALVVEKCQQASARDFSERYQRGEVQLPKKPWQK